MCSPLSENFDLLMYYSLHHQELCDVLLEDHHRSALVFAYWGLFCWISTCVRGFVPAAVNFLQRDSISEHLNSSWKRSGSLLSCFLCLPQRTRGEKIQRLQQWNYQYSLLITIISTLLSFQVAYSLPVFPLQEQDVENQSNSSKFLHNRTW